MNSGGTDNDFNNDIAYAHRVLQLSDFNNDIAYAHRVLQLSDFNNDIAYAHRVFVFVAVRAAVPSGSCIGHRKLSKHFSTGCTFFTHCQEIELE